MKFSTFSIVVNDPSGSEDDDEEGDEADEEGDEDEGEENAEANEVKTEDEDKKSDAEEDLAVSDQEQDKEGEKSNADVSGKPESLESKDVDMNGKEDCVTEEADAKKDAVETNGIDKKDDELEEVKKHCVDEPMAGTSSAGPSNDLDEPSTSTGIKRSDDDDEPTNTEIAWEVLSIAKEIFNRQVTNGEDVKYKLAETLQKLGEIATEWENNELAIELLTECLNLRQQSLPEDDRLIAETHYHIGNAHSFISQIDSANECFQKAIDVIKKRIDNKKIALLDDTKNEETLSTIKDEIRELEDLLPEMVARIEDRADQMMATIKETVRMACSDKEDEERAAKLKSSEPKPINNISHLVKRKRVDNGDSSASSNGTKKICTNDHQAKEVEKTDTA